MAKIIALLILFGILFGGAFVVLITMKKKEPTAQTTSTTSTDAGPATTSATSDSTASGTSSDRPDIRQPEPPVETAPQQMEAKPEPPSLLGFIREQVTQEELVLLNKMACTDVTRIEESDWRANNLVPVLYAKMIVMERKLDSTITNQRLTKADSLNIFLAYLNDHYDELMQEQTATKKKTIKKSKKIRK